MFEIEGVMKVNVVVEVEMRKKSDEEMRSVLGFDHGYQFPDLLCLYIYT